LKGIPLDVLQHQIELDTSIPLAHQARYQLNPNYAAIVKQDINKLFVTSFIKHVEEVIWLSPIIVVPKKNEKLKICVNFKKLNVATKKDPCILFFTNEVYTFLNGYSKYH
jgi:hypothetical protein